MTIVVPDGFTTNLGDLTWAPIETLAPSTVWDRTTPRELIERIGNAQVVVGGSAPMAYGRCIRMGDCTNRGQFA